MVLENNAKVSPVNVDQRTVGWSSVTLPYVQHEVGVFRICYNKAVKVPVGTRTYGSFVSYFLENSTKKRIT